MKYKFFNFFGLILVLLVGGIFFSFSPERAHGAEILLDSCWIHDYSTAGDKYGIPGASIDFSGTCTPPLGTTRIRANLNYDDGGTTYLNNEEINSVEESCEIKNVDVDVTSKMFVGKASTFAVHVINCGLAGVGADVRVYFYGPAPECNINSFTADDTILAFNTGTTLRFSLNGSFPWGITLLEGSGLPDPYSGLGSSGESSTGKLKETKTYRLSCGEDFQDLTVIAQSTEKCEDPKATNFGGTPPCVYSSGEKAAGELEVVGCGNLKGWAWDPDFPSNYSSVQIIKDGSVFTTIEANANNPDSPGNHKHGFIYNIPSAWKDGLSHSVDLVALDLNGDADSRLIGSPKKINCPLSKNSNLIAGTVTPIETMINIPTDFSSTIFNIGDASINKGFYNFLQIASTPFADDPNATITDLPPKSISSLSWGESNTITSSFVFSSAGVYSIRACADKKSSIDSGEISESNENDNCSPWANVAVASECTNGATNPPACTTGSGDQCTNGATNPPVCTINRDGKCLNGAANPPACNKKKPIYQEN